MTELIQISGPTAEPVSLDDVLQDLGYGAAGSLDPATVEILSNRINPLIIAARMSCEAYQRRAYFTQSWMYQLDGFPGRDPAYGQHRYPAIMLPKPPFQSLSSFRYVDASGDVQGIPLDLSYGKDSTIDYAYQLDPGGDTRPARLTPAFARPWPPTRMVPNNVQIGFVCGYGGPLTVTMAAASAAITGVTFLPSDAGRLLSVPGAGASGATLNTTIVSVDGSGNGLTADEAATAVTGVPAYLGNPVPGQTLMAIRFLAQFYYEQGGSVDAPVPRIIASMLGEERNLVS